MDKKHKQHLLVTLIFTLIVTATLFFMYDDFVFQTYGEVVYYDYILIPYSSFFMNLQLAITFKNQISSKQLLN